MFPTFSISHKMFISTFGRVDKQHITDKEIDHQIYEIRENVKQNKKDITDLNVFSVEEFIRNKMIEEKRNKDMWHKFSEHEKKLKI